MADSPEHLRPEARPGNVTPGRDQPRAPDFEPEPERPTSRPDGLGSVSPEVASGATQRGALPLDRLALVGLFSGPKGSSALVRLASGSIVKVAQGADVDGGRVTAISEEALHLQKDGREIVLTMPTLPS